MSGILYEGGTPCPSSRFENSNTFDSFWEDSDPLDDTGNIEFTTEIKAPVLAGAKPRRGNRATSSFHIHEDNEGKPAPTTTRKRESVKIAAPNRKSSLLSQPAQRFRPKVNFAASSPKTQHQQIQSKDKVEGRRSNAEENSALLAQINETGQVSEVKKDVLKKDVRRNTVYIPPDDTTVPSVFMGLFSPLKSQKSGGTKGYGADDSQFISLESRIAARQQTRRTHAAPQRRALQPSSRIAQEAAIRVDIAGKNGGKENIPPGTVANDNIEPVKKLCAAELPQKAKRTPGNGLISAKLTKTQSTTQTSANSGRVPAIKRPIGHSEKRTVLGVKKCNPNASTFDPRKKEDDIKHKPTSKKEAPILRTSNSSNTAKRSRAHTISSIVAAPESKFKKLNTKYPLLAENISNPAMYEDNWLSHQEIVITQLVNGLFEYTDGRPSSDDPEAIRYELLKLYQSDLFVQLHRRLQASLLYGGMAIPKFVLERSSSLKHDLGLKRKFIDIWTQTYDIRALRAALETIVGRRICNDPKASQNSLHSPRNDVNVDDMMLRRKVDHFLEVFLLRNEDMEHHVADTDNKTGAPGRAYRRTVLRSIMVIALLDKGRLCSGTMLPRQLFNSKSRFKSSAAVLRALGRLLLPPSGDINKPLGHLDCRLLYQQHELQEYEYQISNLAVDLRDGVRLTRIVELLLYPSSLCLNGVEPDSDSSTLSLPDGELLSLSGEDGNCPLSQHLRFPCSSRAVKLFNVRIALGALSSTNSTSALVNNVRAEDIVDGHREKTIALLWGLVSKWGLAGLVDWEDVQKEIERLQRKVVTETGYEHVKDRCWFHGEDLGSDRHSSLLKHWASLLAHLKGQHFENLSTNFADGKIYESIVDEYEGYILGKGQEPSTGGLEQRLQALGCSSQFGKTFRS